MQWQLNLKGAAMFAKKMTASLAVLVAAAAVSAPAFADRGYRDHRPHFQHRPAVHHFQHRPVVHHYYHRPAHRRVVVVHQPQPVYHYSHPHTGAALLVGAVIGAAIVHHAITGY